MITIIKDQCSRCGICMECCPMNLLSPNAQSAYPEMPEENKERCTFCGHCEASCPKDCLKHQHPDTLAPSRSQGQVSVSTEQVGLYMRSRRSVRNYLTKPVEKTVIEDIMDIVRFAPSGINRQALQWIVVHSPAKVEELTRATVEWMRMMIGSENPLSNVINFEALVKAYDMGKDFVARRAPHLFIVHTHKDDTIGAADSAIAMSHLDLALPSFGLGGCWAGYLSIALKYVPALHKIINLPENRVVQGVLMAGYPKYVFNKLPLRKKPVISWI